MDKDQIIGYLTQAASFTIGLIVGIKVATITYNRRLKKRKTVNNVLKGDPAKYYLTHLLDVVTSKYWGDKEHLGVRGFYTQWDKKVPTTIAFDNSTGDCWVEDFPKESHAIAWLAGEFEMSDYDEWLNLNN